MKKKHLDWLMALKKRFGLGLKTQLICAVILFGAIFQTQAALPQEGKVNLNLGKTTYKEVFDEIHKQTGYVVMYNNAMLDKHESLDLNVENADLKEVLQDILKEKGLIYKVKDEFIIIEEDKSVKPIQQEKREIKGTVTDENGETLPGVSVVVKGTTYGVSTDIDGNYALIIPEMGGVLVFSFVGMMSQEIQIKDQTILNVVLKSDQSQLGEVVVTGYQTLSKERATGAFSALKTEEVEKITTIDIVENLEGKVSGLVINEEGEIQIRGVSTLFANAQPLIVVDGFPTNQPLSSFDPKDVKSINVLKDAAAASIWGVRASNGVIVITTKDGDSKKDGEVSVGFTASTTYGFAPDLGELDWVNAEEYIDFELETLERKGLQSYWLYGLGLSDVEKLYKNKSDGNISDAEYEAGLEKLRNSDNKKQIGDHLFRNSIINQANVSISASTGKARNFLSVGSYNKKSHFVGNESKRLTINLKSDYKFNDNISAFFRVYSNFSKDESNSQAGKYLSGKILPYSRLLDEDGKYLHQGGGGESTPWNYEEYEAMGYRNWRYNLLEETREADNSTTGNSTRIQAGLNFKLNEGLKFQSSFQYETTNSKNEQYYSEDTYESRHKYNYYTSRDEETGDLTSHWPEGSIYDLGTSNSYSYRWRNQVDFNKKVGEKGSILAIAGTELSRYYVETTDSRKIGYFKNSGEEYKINFEDFAASMSGKTYHKYQYNRYSDNRTNTYRDNRDFSLYANVGYAYDEKLNFTASCRVDQSNLFGTDPKYRYNPLWSMGTSYIISKEDYFNVGFVNHLKVRTTYGYGGNVDRTTSPYLVTTRGFTYKPREEKLTRSGSNPPNPKLRPEKTAMFDVGVDFGIFNNRITGSFDYFSTTSKQLLSSRPVDPTVGYTKLKYNSGSVTNKGFDIDLSARIIDKEFKWDLDLTVGAVKNEVLTSDEYDRYIYKRGYAKPIEGYPAGSIFAVDYTGLNEDGRAIVRKDDGTEITGDVFSWYDLDVEKDFIHMGVRNPKLAGGGSTEFQYKNFRLSLDFTYKFGHKMIMPSPNIYSYGAGNLHSDIAKRWREPGDENNTMVPRLIVYPERGRDHEMYKYSKQNVADASYIKLRHVVVKYLFPRRLIEKYNINRLELKLQVSNVAYWAANKKGYDPDFTTMNGFGLPNPRTVNFGLNVQF